MVTAATVAAAEAATELQPGLSCMRSNYSTFKCFAGNFIAAHRHHHRRVCHSPGTEQTSSQINHLGLPQCVAARSSLLSVPSYLSSTEPLSFSPCWVLVFCLFAFRYFILFTRFVLKSCGKLCCTCCACVGE